MRRIGFSTGALDPKNPKRAIACSRQLGLSTIELSALRPDELAAIGDAIREAADIFKWVSIHAPSVISANDELSLVKELLTLSDDRFSVIVHPDAIHDWRAWAEFGANLLVENMDRRKRVGRYANEFEEMFVRLPEAGLCLDVAHARQVDPSLVEAWEFLTLHRSRLREVHISEVTSQSAHAPMSLHSSSYLKDFLHHLPTTTPIIIESVLTRSSPAKELAAVRQLFDEELSKAT